MVPLLAVVARSLPVFCQIRQIPPLRLTVEGRWSAAYRSARVVARVRAAPDRYEWASHAVVEAVLAVVAGIGLQVAFAGLHGSKTQQSVQFGLERFLLVGAGIAARPAGALGLG